MWLLFIQTKSSVLSKAKYILSNSINADNKQHLLMQLPAHDSI